MILVKCEAITLLKTGTQNKIAQSEIALCQNLREKNGILQFSKSFLQLEARFLSSLADVTKNKSIKLGAIVSFLYFFFSLPVP